MGISGPLLIVASGAPVRLLSDTWKSSLSEVGIDYRVEPFRGECSAQEVARLGKVAKGLGVQGILGAGGGKVLDAVRAVAADLGVPVVSCPTVASSDSPCSALSVMYSESGEVERYRFYPANPALVLVDSAVIAQAPTRLLVAGMGDALATWWEAETVARARMPNQVGGQPTHTATALSELCYKMLLGNAREAVLASDRGVVTPALERIIEANTLLSGVGFESGGLAAAHSVHNGLTTQGGTHAHLHGEKVSFGLLVQLVLEGRSQETVDEVLEFQLSVGLPVTLSGVGMDGDLGDAALRAIAERSLADGETIHHEPFHVTSDALVDAIQTADAVGREALAKVGR